MLASSTTGAVIATIAGETINDQIGVTGVTELFNGNFVIRSNNDDVGGIVDAGSVILLPLN